MDQNLEFMAQMPEEQLQVFVDTLIEKGGLQKHYLYPKIINSLEKIMLNIGIELKKNIELLAVIQLLVFFLVLIHIEKS